jgi:hypothetical protein
MSDLLDGARDLRRKLYRLEVLLEIEKGGPGSKGVERAAAIKRLTDTGLIEAAPVHFRVTPEGREFLKDVRTKVGGGDALDWSRADEIDFSKL